jgi:hypothetical protein
MLGHACRARTDEAAQAVFNADRTRPTERLCHLARQVLEFRRAAAPLAEMLDRLATELPAAPTGDRFRRHFRQQRILSRVEEESEGLRWSPSLGSLVVRQHRSASLRPLRSTATA